MKKIVLTLFALFILINPIYSQEIPYAPIDLCLGFGSIYKTIENANGFTMFYSGHDGYVKARMYYLQDSQIKATDSINIYSDVEGTC